VRWPICLASLAAVCLGCGPVDGHSKEAVGSTTQPLQMCAGQTVEGIDVYDGTGSIDWNAVKSDGVDFAIIKATQGTYNTQGTFGYNWQAAKRAGLLRSAYHFFDPTEDGVAQAQHFLSVVGAAAPDDLPGMLDIECPDGDPSCLGWQGATGDAPGGLIQQRMWDFLDTVERATGKKPIVYSFNAYFWSVGIDPTGLQNYPLNIAYPTGGSCF
jgi:lysozyme